jgi:signal peptidase I
MQTFLEKIIEFIKTMAIAGFVAFFCIRGFIFEPFKIPSGSMMPTLLVGDFLFVSKFAYGNRLPLTDYFFWQTEPKRGDIVVFKREDENLPGSFFGVGDVLFIKRLIALPGDTIAYDGASKALKVNGEVVFQNPVGFFSSPNNSGGKQVRLMTEHLPGAVHSILLNDDVEGLSVPEIVVPSGQYVVMGDNRDNSRDARFWNYPSWGYVPKADIMGRAEFIFWSWDDAWKIRFKRLGRWLKRDTGPVPTTSEGITVNGQ